MILWRTVLIRLFSPVDGFILNFEYAVKHNRENSMDHNFKMM